MGLEWPMMTGMIMVIKGRAIKRHPKIDLKQPLLGLKVHF